MLRKILAGMMVLCGMLSSVTGANAQAVPGYPYKPIRILAPFAPGGVAATELAARAAPIVNLLNREINGVLNIPAVRLTFVSQGGEVIASSPAEFRKSFLEDIKRMGKVIRDAGIRAE